MAKKRIGELLVERGYITQTQLYEALQVQQKKPERICSILIDLGHLSEEMLSKFMSEASGIVETDLLTFEIDRELLKFVPADIALKLEVVPIRKIGDLLILAMVCPIDDAGLMELREVTGMKVKPVLCSRETVRQAIERHTADFREADPDYEPSNSLVALESSMKLHRIGRFVEEIEELPTLPDILTIIASIVNDPKSSAADVAKVIETDASLSANILKVANSAAYGFFREISDVRQAVALLGFKETQALALSISVFSYLTDLTEQQFKEYWNHSFKCATLSRLISFTLRSPGIEGAFIAGLLHDIGKIVLAISMRGKHERVNFLCSTSEISRLEAEEKVFGLTHAEAGYLIGERWLLPAALTSAIRYHHLPEMIGETQELVFTVFLANRFSMLDESEIRTHPALSEDVLDALENLKLSEAAFRDTLDFYSYLIPETVLF